MAEHWSYFLCSAPTAHLRRLSEAPKSCLTILLFRCLIRQTSSRASLPWYLGLNYRIGTDTQYIMHPSCGHLYFAATGVIAEHLFAPFSVYPCRGLSYLAAIHLAWSPSSRFSTGLFWHSQRYLPNDLRRRNIGKQSYERESCRTWV